MKDKICSPHEEFVVEAFIWNSEKKRWKSEGSIVMTAVEIPYHVVRLSGYGYRITIKPRFPDDFWSE